MEFYLLAFHICGMWMDGMFRYEIFNNLTSLVESVPLMESLIGNISSSFRLPPKKCNR